MFNKIIANVLPHMPKKLVWAFSKRYIAGETIEEGLLISKRLNEENILVTIDLLGEFIQTIREAEENKKQYFEIINRFTKEKIKGFFSLKPTMFGLLFDPDTCYKYIREIVALASKNDSFVRIDMEDSQCTDSEIELFKRLRAEFPKNVGLVLQSYMRRTLNDLKNLNTLNTQENPINIRLCKGIYIEPEKIAYKGYQEVRDKYLENLEYMLENRMYTAIATHDKYLVDNALSLLEEHNIPKEMYEFQMLYGVTPDLRKSIIDRGHTMRVYVPFGKHWFDYSTRRLKENPQLVTNIIKTLFIKG
ncbi:MAG: proline dehydrogenase [Draconibacterium sp.]|nr:MAG: proline dehydrogenase [Draconibacterium sp.]